MIAKDQSLGPVELFLTLLLAIHLLQRVMPRFVLCLICDHATHVLSQILQGFIRDCYHPDSKLKLDPNEPLYVIELGAGSGKFSYFILKILEEMQAVCEFPFKKIVFVMTDFTEKNLKFWQDHPALTKYFESGQLDAGIFDAVNDKEIHLWKSGKILGPNSCVNPVCIVANYLFDTLYHDIFQVEGGELKEGLVSVGSKHR